MKPLIEQIVNGSFLTPSLSVSPGHFLLTFLLLDLLTSSAPSRVITLSSMAHAWGRIQLEDVNSETSYHSRRAYGQSKLANILSTRSLARRLQGQECYLVWGLL